MDNKHIGSDIQNIEDIREAYEAVRTALLRVATAQHGNFLPENKLELGRLLKILIDASSDLNRLEYKYTLYNVIKSRPNDDVEVLTENISRSFDRWDWND